MPLEDSQMPQIIKKPKKHKNLKLIELIDSTYAMFDMHNAYKIDKVATNILVMCDGERTVKQIVDELSRRANLKPEDVKPVLRTILEEMEKLGFIEWV